MQEHPGRHTDEQITQMLADDPELAELMEQLAMTKRAFAKQEADKEHLAMDGLWEQFASEHKEELDNLESAEDTEPANRPTPGSRPVKVVSNPPQQKTPATAIPTDTAMTDTATMAVTVTPEPVVFDNVRLDEILPQIAAHYQAEVTFKSEATRQLRFHFVWRREDGLEHAIEKLNRFESLSIRLEDSKIIVE